MEHIKIYRYTAKLNNIDLFYLDTKTEKPVILCLHGKWGRGETWCDFMEHYGKQYRIIAPDLRGHGLSGKPVAKYTSQEMAEDMVELLHFLNIKSAIVIGHSMGGRVAGYLAAHYPETIKAAAILDISARGPATPSLLPPEEIPCVDPFTKDWPLPFSSLAEATDFIREKTDSEYWCRQFMSDLTEAKDGYQLMHSPQAMSANTAYDTGWFDLLPKIQCPVLLIRAKNSMWLPEDDFKKMGSLIPNCCAYEFSETDHYVYLANTKKFYECMNKLLNIADEVSTIAC